MSGLSLVQTSMLVIFILSWVLGAFFHLRATPQIVAAYRQWGYPPHFHYVAGAIHSAIVLCLMFEASRQIGLLLAGITIAAALATLIYHKEFGHLWPSALMAAAIGILLL